MKNNTTMHLRRFNIFHFSFFILSSFILLSACSVQNKIGKSVTKELLNDSSLINAHLGIYIYDATANKPLYDYQGNKFFVPASNTKIPTCYAAMKYLGDSLAGLRYFSNDTALFIIPTGDPTLLHRDYTHQPVIDFLRQSKKKIYINSNNWKEEALGYGWAWDDYNDDYMAERSALPVYGNTVKWSQYQQKKETPSFAADTIDTYVAAEPDISWTVHFNPDLNSTRFSVKRSRDDNTYTITEGREKKAAVEIPFYTDGIHTALKILKDTLLEEVRIEEKLKTENEKIKILYSRPLDSMLTPMMHRSDNFFAEQSLLMVSNERLGYMNDQKIIDALLKTDLKDIPQKPKWVDGSGLSRYNLFTPQDFVFILRKMKDEFGLERLKVIFPTGGTGTTSNYYKNLQGKLFAKTGTLSNHVALSGYLITQKNKVLVFSVLVNAHPGAATPVRRAVERFLTGIYNNY
jgi:D-alanyl-D-alanine carboxypeptidase/D-alanyl-D-alanine-endopeptidase (penicillin-binding protein 4)